MRVKRLKEILTDVGDDVEVTLVTFDYEQGGREFFLNLSCTQADKTRLRFAPGLDIRAVTHLKESNFE